jgi:hypothetical protein
VSRTAPRAKRLAVSAAAILAALSLATAASAASGGAEPRFGDSTWVAPNARPAGDPAEDGPRVHEPDHERTWETVLRTPFRVAFLPFRLLARGFEAGANFVEEHWNLQSFENKKPGGRPTRVSVGPQFSLSGSEGIGLGATVKGPIVDPKNQFRLDAMYTHLDTRRVRLRTLFGEGSSIIGVGAEGIYDYRPNRRFYGIGNDVGAARTIFLEQEIRGDGWVFFGRDSTRRIRAIAGISDAYIDDGYNAGGAHRASEVFDPADVPFLTSGSRVKSYGAAGQFAVLNSVHQPSQGIHFLGEARHVTSMGDDSNLRFESWRAETRGYLPVFSPRRVIALRGVLQGVDPDAGTDSIPFYRLPVSVKQNRFAGYSGDRFRDRRLALVHAEYRWLIWASRMYAFALAERAQVAPSNHSLRWADMHEAYGGGLRYHLTDTQNARLEVAKGSRGVTIDLELDAEF